VLIIALLIPAQAAPFARREQVNARATDSVEVRKVTVARGRGTLAVHIEGSGPLRPAATKLSKPDRIIIDLPNTRYGRTLRIPLSAGDVEGLRVGLYQQNPPVTRVVVDMTRPHQYHLSPSGSRLTVTIETGEKGASEEAAPEAPVTTPAPTPDSQEAVVVKPPPLTADLEKSLRPMLPPPVTAPQLSPQPKPPAAPAPSSETALADDAEGTTTAHQASKAERPLEVRSVTISRGGSGAVEVHILGNGPLKPAVTSFRDRLVVDFANTSYRHILRIPVNAADVQTVDVFLFLVNPPVTRVVVALARPHSYHLVTSGNLLTVRVDPQTAATQPQ
jgi:hypothetical protein